MITNDGKTIILRDLAGQGPRFAEYLVFGAGRATPAATDKRLDFEVIESPVDLVDYDEATSKIIVRAPVPAGFDMDIHEVGVAIGAGLEDEPVTTILTRFSDTEFENLTGGDFVTGARVGQHRYEVSPGDGVTTTVVRDVAVPDWTSMLSSDTFALLYNHESGNISSIEVRLVVDGANYRSHSFVPSAGYGVERWQKSDFVQTGTAPWSDIQHTEFLVTGGVGGGVAHLDAFRADNANAEFTLVARSVFVEPIEKRGVAQVQVEYDLGITFDA